MNLSTLLTLSTLIAFGAWDPARAETDVDASLDEIAGQIIQRTEVGDKPTIGISTFTHADGTCSQLSNYITEFIVDSLFNAAGGDIDIIERSQLSAIFREMQMVYDGTIAPDTAKRLGDIAGVDALVTGSLIQFGEQVKVQARLIGTSDGRLFATARSDFPSVGSVADMMNDRHRAACDFKTASGEPETKSLSGSVQETSETRTTDDSRVYASEDFRAEISNLAYDKSSGQTAFSVRIANTAEKTIGLSYVPRSMSISDSTGSSIDAPKDVKGIRSCYASNLALCNTSKKENATVLPQGDIIQMNFQTNGHRDTDNLKINLSFEMVVTPDVNNKDYRLQSISFFDVSPDQL